MSDPYILRSLELAGFRAYLHPKTFDFTQKRCLAIFAPNGNGKSSVIDALEFMFSKDGTLERLGQRTINNQAGPVALAHNLAEEAKIDSTVTIGVITGKTTDRASRSAAGTKRTIPNLASEINAGFVVPPIIRGHSLRTFVEAHTSEQRYADIANWLQLGPLVEVQKNIRALRTQIKTVAEDDAPLKRFDTLLAKEANLALKIWNATAIIDQANRLILAPLDPKLTLKDLAPLDSAYLEVQRRATSEGNSIGLAGLRHLRRTAASLQETTVNNPTGERVSKGAIPIFGAALSMLSSAEGKEAEERGKAANTMFQSVWNAAEPLFAEGVVVPEVCPVCNTPLALTAAGSAESIRTHLSKQLAELADYAAAHKTYTEAKAEATRAHAYLMSSLSSLIELLGEDDTILKTELENYQIGITCWLNGTTASLVDIQTPITSFLARLDSEIANIEAKQGEQTYIGAKAKIDKLLEWEEERNLALQTRDELSKLSADLTKQSAFVSAEIRKRIQALLDKLQKPMNDIYEIIQGSKAMAIRLELPAEDDTNQQRLNLLIDFAKNRTGVQPGGYLSDSQVHSVALALRMAAIQLFNAGAPLMALDDIVTSYDADHRRTIAGLISTKFNDCQILITTHDERFFNYLKDQAVSKTWHFTRIIGLDPGYGPRFADHKVSDEMIEARWAAGQSAANEMRQAEEEWLLGICRDFGVSVRIRSLEKAYSYERSELASALGSLLKDIEQEPAMVPGVNNRFLASLVKGEIENFGSHFQDGLYGEGSLGDEKTRWKEFTAFRAQFVCKNCSRTKFQRPFSLKTPICAHNGCETQFEFTTAPAIV